jgi:putative oxidoreductase
MDTLRKPTDNSSHAEKAKILVDAIRSTTHDRILGALRLLLGGLFVMTGLMKLFVSMLGEAFSGQLLAAHIPFYEFNIWFVPITEVVIGALLLVGLFSRIGGLVAINMMLVATYVHLVVDNPHLFPLQPEAPIIPLAAIAVAAYVVWRGGGAWSADLRSSQ